VELQPRVLLNDAGVVCRSAVMGLGIALVATPQALPYLDSGELVRLLPDWYADIGPLCLYFSGQKLLPAKTRAFIEVITNHFHQQKLAQRFAAT
jgi:DNA-binding transcriptional LysR family regulator